MTETKIVKEVKNFVIDKNGKKQEVKMDSNGQPYYVSSDGKRVNIPK
jgi:hypothetical protein